LPALVGLCRAELGMTTVTAVLALMLAPTVMVTPQEAPLPVAEAGGVPLTKIPEIAPVVTQVFAGKSI